jgi:DNA-binding transcriptional MerR regulator
MSYSISTIADLCGVSVRTLHHYDRIGLLKPASIETNGYRVYTDTEVARLRWILLLREVGYSLEDIQARLDSTYFNAEATMEEIQSRLVGEQERIGSLLMSIQNYMNTDDTIAQNKIAHMDAGLDEKTADAYANEVYTRWGNTGVYKQSVKKVSKMSTDEMQKLKEDGKRHTQAIADAMDLGIESDVVQALIKQSHEGVNFFYDCSIEMFRNLGQMYVDDPRFGAYYEKFRPGLAVFMRCLLYTSDAADDM